MRKFMLSAAAFFMACFSTLAQEPPKACEDRAEQPMLVVPAGTPLSLLLQNGISTRSVKAGQAVHFEILSPVTVENRIAIPAGSFAQGKITEGRRAGRRKGRAEVRIRLESLILPNGYSVSLEADTTNVSTGGDESVDSNGRVRGDTARLADAGMVVAGAAVGAALGGIMGRSEEAVGLGAISGGGTGLIAVLLTRGPDLHLPRGSTVDATLAVDLHLDAARAQFTDAGRASTMALLAPRQDRREPPLRPRWPFPW